METRCHEHHVELPVEAEKAFRMLVTPSDIREWWGASRAIVIAEEGGTWAASWGDEDAPDYVTVASIAAYDPPRRLLLTNYRYQSKDGKLPFEASFQTEFIVEPAAGGCVVRVRQDGFPADPAADTFLAACERGWHDTLGGLRRHASRS